MEPTLSFVLRVLRLESVGCLEEQRVKSRIKNRSPTISVPLYNIDRCIMSILLQHLLHQPKTVWYFLPRHAAFLQNFR